MSRMPGATLIINPRAGNLNTRNQAADVAQFWRHRGWALDIEPTQYSGHAIEIAKEAALKGKRLVLVAGGDGTVSEAATGLANSNAILATLPAGTGNSLAKELCLQKTGLMASTSLLKASRELADGFVYKMDMGHANTGKDWLQWAGAGVDGHVVRAIEPRSRLNRKLRGLGYLAVGLPAISRFQPMSGTVTVDGTQYTGDYVMVTISNCRRYVGGMFELNPKAQLDDGLFDIWLLSGRRWLKVFHYAALLARGRHLDYPGVIRLTGKQIRIDATPATPVHFDGEPGGLTPLECKIRHRSLLLLAPRSAPPDLFRQTGLPLSEYR